MKSEMVAVLYDAGFDIENEFGDYVHSASRSSMLPAAFHLRKRKRRHLQTCNACKSTQRSKSLKIRLTSWISESASRSLDNVDDSIRSGSSILLESNMYRVSLSIGGMTCAACVNAIMDALKDTPGVSELTVDLLGKCGSALVTQQEIGREIRNTIEDIGYECELVAVEPISNRQIAAPELYRAVLSIAGMTCASCESAISRNLASLDFVQAVNVSFLGHSGTVEFSPREKIIDIKRAVEETGYECDVMTLVKLGSSAQSSRTVLLKVNGMSEYALLSTHR